MDKTRDLVLDDTGSGGSDFAMHMATVLVFGTVKRQLLLGNTTGCASREHTCPPIGVPLGDGNEEHGQ